MSGMRTCEGLPVVVELFLCFCAGCVAHSPSRSQPHSDNKKCSCTQCCSTALVAHMSVLVPSLCRKTGIVMRFMYDKFDDNYQATIGIDFLSKVIDRLWSLIAVHKPLWTAILCTQGASRPRERWYLCHGGSLRGKH